MPEFQADEAFVPFCAIFYLVMTVLYLVGLFILNRHSHRHLTQVIATKHESITDAEIKSADQIDAPTPLARPEHLQSLKFREQNSMYVNTPKAPKPEGIANHKYRKALSFEFNRKTTHPLPFSFQQLTLEEGLSGYEESKTNTPISIGNSEGANPDFSSSLSSKSKKDENARTSSIPLIEEEEDNHSTNKEEATVEAATSMGAGYVVQAAKSNQQVTSSIRSYIDLMNSKKKKKAKQNDHKFMKYIQSTPNEV